jgi:hypothetical protein
VLVIGIEIGPGPEVGFDGVFYSMRGACLIVVFGWCEVWCKSMLGLLGAFSKHKPTYAETYTPKKQVLSANF